MDNISFRGAFLLKNPTPTMKEQITNCLGKKKFIYEGLKEAGDVFYVVRNSSDKKIADFIDGRRVKFEYYPELNTKSGFQYNNIDGARELVNSTKSPIIRAKNILKSMFSEPEIKKSKRLKYFERAMNAVGLSKNEYQICPANGFAYIKDKTSKKYIGVISAPSEIDAMYVKISPQNTDLDPARYVIDKIDGEILHEYKGLKGKEKFDRKFNEAVEYNKKMNK